MNDNDIYQKEGTESHVTASPLYIPPIRLPNELPSDRKTFNVDDQVVACFTPIPEYPERYKEPRLSIENKNILTVEKVKKVNGRRVLKFKETEGVYELDFFKFPDPDTREFARRT